MLSILPGVARGRRALAAVLVALVLAGALPGALPALAYGPAPVYQVGISGPSRAVDCGRSVELRATVLSTETGRPVRRQVVRWTIAEGASGDRLSATQGVTAADGTTTVVLTLAVAAGDRRIRASAAGSDGRVAIAVRCSPPPATPAPTRKPRRSPRPSSAPPAAPVEIPALRIGYRTEDLAGRAPFLAAEISGAVAAAGLEPLTLVPAPDGLAALRDGRVEIAVVPVAEAMDAIRRGEPFIVIAGYRPWWPNLIAAAPTPLPSGAPLILGDDPERLAAILAALAEAGRPVDPAIDPVLLPPGGPDAWLAPLLAGEVALAPVRNADRLALSRAGAPLLVDRQEWGGELLVAGSAFPGTAPATLAAFLDAYLAGLAALADPANDPALERAARMAGIVYTDAVVAGWPSDLEDFRPADGGLGTPGEDGGLAALHAWAAARARPLPIPGDAIALGPLNAAQARRGAAPDPALPALPPGDGRTIRVATPADDPGAALPLERAGLLGVAALAGLSGVVALPAADPIAELAAGRAELAIVPADLAAALAADAAGPRTIAGWRADGEGGPALVVLASAADAADPDRLAPVVATLLRGLAALDHADAAEALPSRLRSAYLPGDGSIPPGIPAALAAPEALAIARAALGLAGDRP